MAVQNMSVKDAPRDTKGLAEAGRFPRKQLAKALGMLDTEEKVAGWSTLSDDDQVKELHTALAAYDKEGGGGSSTATDSKPKRTPSTKGSESSNNGNGGGDASSADVTKILQNQKEILAGLEVIIANQDRTERLAVLALTLNLNLAEQVLSAPRTDVMEACVDEMKQTVELVGKVVNPAAAGKKK